MPKNTIQYKDTGAYYNTKRLLTEDDNTGTPASGTTGQIQFNSGTNTFSADSNLYWDNVNKHLLVGPSGSVLYPDRGPSVSASVFNFKQADNTYANLFRQNLAGPGQHFHFIGDIPKLSGSDTQAVMFGYNSDISHFYFTSKWNGANTHLFGVEPKNNVAFFDSSLNVGIGTSTPSEKLDINGSLLLRTGDFSSNDNGKVQIKFGLNGTDQYKHYITTGHNAAFSDNSINFYTSDGVANGVYPTNAIHNLSLRSGKAGIGTYSPSAKLHVDEDSTLSAVVAKFQNHQSDAALDLRGGDGSLIDLNTYQNSTGNALKHLTISHWRCGKNESP